MITISDIKESAQFQTQTGIIWIIDSIEENAKYGTLVHTSMSHGSKGNYRNSIDDVVSFLNEKKAEEITETDIDEFDEQDQEEYDNLNRGINGQIEEIN